MSTNFILQIHETRTQEEEIDSELLGSATTIEGITCIKDCNKLLNSSGEESGFVYWDPQS